jgi:anti-anti-sigma regulatory factor
LPIAFYEGRTRCVIRLEGDIDITCSDELKRTLIEAISTRKELQVDLARATDLDVTAIQLLWAATREAKSLGASFGVAGQVPENIINTVREAGFEKFPVPMSPQVEQENSTASPVESVNDR